MKDEEIPFTIKPEKKVSARQMFEIYRSTYEGTEFDMLKNLNTEVKRWTRNENGELVAVSDTTCPVSPYMTNAMRSLLNNLKPGTVSWAYTISVIQCSYSEIIKLRSWLPDEVGGVAYFAFDIPALTPRVPIYAGQTKLPAGFEVCGQKRYRKDAAIWRFRETNRLAAFGWNRTASRMKKALKEYDDMIFDDAPALEKKAVQLIKEGRKEEAVELLNSYCSRLSASQQKTWEELKEEFWGIFARSL